MEENIVPAAVCSNAGAAVLLQKDQSAEYTAEQHTWVCLFLNSPRMKPKSRYHKGDYSTKFSHIPLDNWISWSALI